MSTSRSWLTWLEGYATPGRCLPLFLVAGLLDGYRRFAELSPGASSLYREVVGWFLVLLALATAAACAPAVGGLAERLVRRPRGWLVLAPLAVLLVGRTLEFAFTAAPLVVWVAWARERPATSAPARAFAWLVAAAALVWVRALRLQWASTGSYRAACVVLLALAVVAFARPALGEAVVALLRRTRPGLLLGALSALLLAPPEVVRAGGWVVAWCLWAGGWGQTAGDLRWAWRGVLALGLGLRLLFVLGAPWPYWSYDAIGYVGVVHAALLGHEGALDPVRTPGYPAFVLATVGPLRSYLAFLVASHGLGLGVAWWAGRALRRLAGEAGGLLLFTWLALFPKLLDYEHTLGPEALFVALLTIASVHATRLLLRPAPGAAAPATWLALGAGLAASLAVLTRPAGLAVLPPLVFAALWRRLPVAHLAALLAAISLPLLGWAGHNGVRHGSFGLSRIGDLALFGVAGHLVDPDSPGWEELKQEMRPGLARHDASRPFWNPNFNWLVYSPSGPLSCPRARALEGKEYFETVRAISLQAIAGRPAHFAARCGYQLWVYLLQPEPTPILRWPCPLESLRDSRVELQPAEARALVDTPAARALAGLRASPALYDLMASVAGLVGAFPFHLAEHPLVAALLLLAAVARRRERPALLFLSGAAMSLVVAVCVMNDPLPRYHIQTVPLLAVGVSLVVGRVVHGRRGQPPLAPASTSSPPSRRQRLTVAGLAAAALLASGLALASLLRPPPWASVAGAAPYFDGRTLAALPAAPPILARRGERWTFREQGTQDVVWQVGEVEDQVRYVSSTAVGADPERSWQMAPLGAPSVVLGLRRETLQVSGRAIDCVVIEAVDRRVLMDDVRRTTWVAVSGDTPTFPGVLRVELALRGTTFVTWDAVAIEGVGR